MSVGLNVLKLGGLLTVPVGNGFRADAASAIVAPVATVSLRARAALPSATRIELFISADMPEVMAIVAFGEAPLSAVAMPPPSEDVRAAAKLVSKAATVVAAPTATATGEPPF